MWTFGWDVYTCKVERCVLFGAIAGAWARILWGWQYWGQCMVSLKYSCFTCIKNCVNIEPGAFRIFDRCNIHRRNHFYVRDRKKIRRLRSNSKTELPVADPTRNDYPTTPKAKCAKPRSPPSSISVCAHCLHLLLPGRTIAVFLLSIIWSNSKALVSWRNGWGPAVWYRDNLRACLLSWRPLLIYFKNCAPTIYELRARDTIVYWGLFMKFVHMKPPQELY